MLVRHRVHNFLNPVYLGRSCIYAMGMVVPKHRNVLAVLNTPAGKLLYPTHNIVTDAGDIYYAQRGASESPTNAFGIMELASAGTPAKDADRSDFTEIGSTQKAFTGGYPQTDDDHADNTGAGADIITYLASYAKADFSHAAISHGIITNTGPGASEPILTGFEFVDEIEDPAPFEKTLNDTLLVFVNHTMDGS